MDLQQLQVLGELTPQMTRSLEVEAELTLTRMKNHHSDAPSSRPPLLV